MIEYHVLLQADTVISGRVFSGGAHWVNEATLQALASNGGVKVLSTRTMRPRVTPNAGSEADRPDAGVPTDPGSALQRKALVVTK